MFYIIILIILLIILNFSKKENFMSKALWQDNYIYENWMPPYRYYKIDDKPKIKQYDKFCYPFHVELHNRTVELDKCHKKFSDYENKIKDLENKMKILQEIK